MSNPEGGPYEESLIRALEAIELQMKELEAERSALRRQLAKARMENNNLRDVNRRNSASRVMIERRVLEALTDSVKPLSTRKLYSFGQLANFDLKEGTFRTCLHRMKIKGLIESAAWGFWQLPKAKLGFGSTERKP